MPGMRAVLALTVSLIGSLVACGDDGGSAPPADARQDAPTADAMPDGPAVMNGCTRAMAVDLSAAGATRTIAVTDDIFTPKCMRIAPGQTVTWQGDLSIHPLAPGIVRSNQIVAQPGHPITTITSSGTMVSYAFGAAGDWAFYCPNHLPGMAGIIYVE